ncbi:hypothetical protein GAPWKB30_0854 [Gilliamella apicola]|nr:hypothetical protein GAPWKB30_0854 [Gilliamella apicola]
MAFYFNVWFNFIVDLKFLGNVKINATLMALMKKVKVYVY